MENMTTTTTAAALVPGATYRHRSGKFYRVFGNADGTVYGLDAIGADGNPIQVGTVGRRQNADGRFRDFGPFRMIKSADLIERVDPRP